MNSTSILLLGALKIAVINLVMSADNIGAIALSIRNLPEDLAKKANLAGLIGAFLIRLVLCMLIAQVMKITWLPVRLAGGLLLVWITWEFVNPKEESIEKGEEPSTKFWKAIKNIVIADLSMSLDNVLAMAGAAGGNNWLIGIGLLVTFPVIFWGSEIVSSLMQKYKMVIYAGAAVLMHTAISMILEDQLTEHLAAGHFSVLLKETLPWIGALVVLLYGIFEVKKKGNMSELTGVEK